MGAPDAKQPGLPQQEAGHAEKPDVPEGAAVTTYYVTLELHATLTDPPGNLTDDDVVQHLADVLHTLESAEDVDDPDIIATLATGDVTFTGFVDTDSFDDAARQFSSAVRAAIHASHGATPDWSPDWELLEIQIGASEKTPV